jgi:hypothetical protein
MNFVDNIKINYNRSMDGAEEDCIYGFGGKARKEKTTRKTRYRWENNIEMDLR